jgi:hypothetical protein
MIPISVDYRTAIRATTRKTRSIVQINWSDPSTDFSSYVITANENNRISYPDQVADNNFTPTYKWANLCSLLKCDENFAVCPSPSEISANQMGWFGATVSGSSGVFGEPYPAITVSFPAQPIFGLCVKSDLEYVEYPVDFDVEIYNGITLLYTETVVGNNTESYEKDIEPEQITAATSIKLIIKKWSAESAVVKILEFFSVITKTYDGNDIISLSLTEELEDNDGSIAVGNISANEIDLQLQNIFITSFGQDIYDPFLPWNDNSPYRNLLKKNRKITAWIGVELPSGLYEDILLGTFYSGDWSMSNGSGVVSVTARDRMELLRNSDFSTSELYVGLNLWEIATIVLESARDAIPMPDLAWSIATRLMDAEYVIPYAWMPKKSYMATLKDIAVACLGTCYIDRNDTLVIL